jgi:hypothetical protein
MQWREERARRLHTKLSCDDLSRTTTLTVETNLRLKNPVNPVHPPEPLYSTYSCHVHLSESEVPKVGEGGGVDGVVHAEA